MSCLKELLKSCSTLRKFIEVILLFIIYSIHLVSKEQQHGIVHSGFVYIFLRFI